MYLNTFVLLWELSPNLLIKKHVNQRHNVLSYATASLSTLGPKNKEASEALSFVVLIILAYEVYVSPLKVTPPSKSTTFQSKKTKINKKWILKEIVSSFQFLMWFNFPYGTAYNFRSKKDSKVFAVRRLFLFLFRETYFKFSWVFFLPSYVSGS